AARRHGTLIPRSRQTRLRSGEDADDAILTRELGEDERWFVALIDHADRRGHVIAGKHRLDRGPEQAWTIPCADNEGRLRQVGLAHAFTARTATTSGNDGSC